jgi:hypothetical protein
VPQIESDLELTSWRDELNRAFAVTGEGWGDVEAMTLDDAALDRRFDADWGSTDGARFSGHSGHFGAIGHSAGCKFAERPVASFACGPWSPQAPAQGAARRALEPSLAPVRPHPACAGAWPASRTHAPALRPGRPPGRSARGTRLPAATRRVGFRFPEGARYPFSAPETGFQPPQRIRTVKSTVPREAPRTCRHRSRRSSRRRT